MEELDWEDILDFGKYKGTTVRKIYFTDPEYLLWLLEESEHDFSEEVLQLLSSY